MKILGCFFLVFTMILPDIVWAEVAYDEATVKENTVEENIVLMDTDKNGVVDVMEIRAYLEKLHGEGYKKNELDFLVSTAKGKSCGTPFAQRLY